MLCIHCALLCEARPVIEHWRLQVVTHKPFKIYRRDDVALVVSGIGKTLTAAALAYLFARNDDALDCVWLNIGIAGSATEPRGALRRANKITDMDSGQTWYPPGVGATKTSGAQLSTFGKPHADYRHNGMYDLEAAAFYNIASRFSTHEWIQSLKVISDTNENEMNALDEQQATQLIGDKLLPMVEYADALLAQNKVWMRTIQDPSYYKECLQQWRFTVSQQQQLHRLLQRYAVLNATTSAQTLLSGMTTAKSVLMALENGLSSVHAETVLWP